MTSEKTKEAMVDDLRNVYNIFIDRFPGKVLNRDFYRKNGKYKEGQINEVFGGFSEFKQTLFDDPEVQAHILRLEKSKQKMQDNQRIDRKNFREFIRLDNSIEGYSQSIMELLQKHDLSKFKLKTEKVNGKYLGVVQLSDLHLNELVSQSDNEYSFDIAAKRLKKLATLTKEYFSIRKIDTILITCSGDFVNSDRRRDEFLNLVNNRSKATVLAVFLIKQFICDLMASFSKIEVAGVSGNESRVNEEYGYSDIITTDNYDYTIISMLKMVFKSVSDQVHFHDVSYKESIISINDYNILLLHGEGIRKERDVQSILGKWAYRGIIINYVLFGHIHQAFIADFFARSSSLVGGNAYSDKALHLVSRASQNIHIVDTKSKSIDSIKLDLQHTEGIEGYDIIQDLEAYNIKSASKINDSKVVIEIRI